MKKNRIVAVSIAVCAVLGLTTLAACGKKEESKLGVDQVLSSNPEISSTQEPLLIGRTPNCEVYLMTDRYSQLTERKIYVAECSKGSASIATP